MTIKTADEAIAWLRTVKHFNCGQVVEIIEAAAAREAALRGELEKWQAIAGRRTGERTEFINERNDAQGERDALQRRLTIAERALDRIHRRSEMFIDDGMHMPVPSIEAIRDIAASALLKPAAELPPMNPVEGDKLPPIGGKVFIHLNSSDSWVEHTVAGYYVWNDLQGDTTLHRVFVRVRDSAGCLNARLLKDIRLSAEG